MFAAVLFFMLGNLLSATAVAQPPENVLRAIPAFEGFVSSLSSDDLNGGRCVANSRRFHELLQSRREVDLRGARIVLFVLPPGKGGMPQPIVPNAAFVNGRDPGFWVWHAFLLLDGYVFDANYSAGVKPMAEYWNTLWAKDPRRTEFWIYSVSIEMLADLQGNSGSGRPKFLRYEPISPEGWLAHPDHVSRLKPVIRPAP